VSDYTLNTNDHAEGAIIIDGHRYLRRGLTRTVQKTVQRKRRELTKLEEQAKAAEEAEDYERSDELDDEAARCIIDMVGALLVSENGAEPAAVYLQEAWDSDRLQADRHLYPLMQMLVADMELPVPPA
jgi:hypothetical protein